MTARVYIASPYTVGDREENVLVQARAYHALRDVGLFPFAPLLSHHLHVVQERTYEDWMEIDFHWLRQCHCVLRLPGESSGADREVALAKSLGMPVRHSVASVVLWYRMIAGGA